MSLKKTSHQKKDQILLQQKTAVPKTPWVLPWWTMRKVYTSASLGIQTLIFVSLESMGAPK